MSQNLEENHMRTVHTIAIAILIFLTLCLTSAVAKEAKLVGESIPEEPDKVDNQVDSKTMQRPLLGFVYASDVNQMRAILGIPGAAVLSDIIPLPRGVAKVNLAPGQKHAIVERTGKGSIGVITFPGASAGPFRAIPGAISHPEIISFNPSGSAAVVYSSSEGWLQVIQGFPSNPKVSRSISFRDIPDAIRLLAIADDRVTLLLGTDNTIFRLNGFIFRHFLNTRDLEAMVFVPGSRDFIYADRAAGSVSILNSAGASSSGVQLIEGLAPDGAIAVQVNSGKAIVTSTSIDTSEVWQVDLKNFDIQHTQLAAKPTMLHPLRTAGRFLLSYDIRMPAWILDTSGESAVLSFVPAR
jgi:hypothetical protein